MNKIQQDLYTHLSLKSKTAATKSGLLKFLDQFACRAVDICAATLGLIVLSPLFVWIGIMIKRDTSGPIFYWGPRAGRDEKPFRILKFRTMYERTESYQGPKVTAQGDDRITATGKWLRDTKLNELPQLWNVLIGEMSLVGPRPEDPDIVKTWPNEVRKELLSIRPGVTSPASIVYRDEESLLQDGHEMDDYLRSILPSKLRLDQLYTRNRNIVTDLDILFCTFVVLIPRVRQTPFPKHWLSYGPFSWFMGRFFNWFTIDVLTASLATGVAGLMWRLVQPLDLGWSTSLAIGFGIGLSFSLANVVLRLNQVYWSKASANEALDLLISSGIATILLIILNWLLHTTLPLGMLLLGGAFSFIGFVTIRYRERLLTGFATRWLEFRKDGNVIRERTLVIGAGEIGSFSAWLFRHSDLSQRFTIVGMVDDDSSKQGMRIDGCMVLGTTADIPDIVRQHDIEMILFSIANITSDDRARILRICKQTPARMVVIPDFMDTFQEQMLSGDSLNPVLANNVSSIPTDIVRMWLKQLEYLSNAQDTVGFAMKIQDFHDILGEELKVSQEPL